MQHMNTHAPEVVPATAVRASWRDYYELGKPRIVLLIVFTAIVGMFLAVPGIPPLQQFIAGTVGIGLAASCASAINHLLDRRATLPCFAPATGRCRRATSPNAR